MTLEQIRAVVDAAPPGPWHVPGPDVMTDDLLRDANGTRLAGGCCCVGFNSEEAEKFIAASRTLMPKLLKVAELSKRVAAQARQLNRIGTPDAMYLEEALAALEAE